MSDRRLSIRIDALAKIVAPPYLVKRLLTAGSMSVFFGEPKSRKSFIMLDLALHVALGWEWCGQKVLQGAVVYVVAEGFHNINNRVEAFFEHHGVKRDDVPLYVMQPVILGDDNDDALAILEDIERQGIRPVLIVLDTLNRTMVGDENSTKEMSTYVRRVDFLRGKTKAHVAIIHHCGKNPDRGARGSSALKGAVDTEVLVERSEDLSMLTVQVQRDLPENFRRVFEPKVIDVGADEDGDKITSLVMLPTEREPEVEGNRDKLALDALSDLVKRDRIRAGDVGAGCEGRFLVAQVEAWKAAFVEKYAGKAKVKAFTRARASLLKKGEVGVEGPWAWPVWPSGDAQGEMSFEDAEDEIPF